MLVRGALRLAADVPPKTHTHDLPQLARFLQRTLLSRHASNTPAARALSRAYRSALSDYRRTYATARATKPTATVKKAVKAKAAAKKPATRSTTAKKTATKPKPKKKPVAKKKTIAKKKPVKKPAPKKRVKKEVTAEAKAKADIAALKKRALKEPCSPRVVTARNVHVAEVTAGAGSAVKAKLLEAGAKWKSLTPAEIEHYNHLASERTAAKLAEYQAWIRTFTPAEIKDANLARNQLRKKVKLASGRSPAHTTKLHDDRHVKQAKTAYTFFFTERQTSGDFKSIRVADAAKLISQEWKALSASERKKYDDEAIADKARYQRELAAQ